MTETSETVDRTVTEAGHVDVLIVGAGISGIGAAHHLREQCPDKSFVILESMETFGGTWWTHTYPGIRSDSDLFTFGYRFKPWPGPPIASGAEILEYLGEVIEDDELEPHICYRHRVVSAAWSSDDRRWSLDVMHTDTGEHVRYTTSFLWMCQGYYRHAEGYTPDWPGMDRFDGPIVHPQTWPEDLDYRGKKVVVIGSGATAATVVPAIAGECEHVTMLQRSPTYFIPGHNVNELADQLRELEIDETWIHEITRRKILKDQELMVRLSFEQPELVKKQLIEGVRALLGPDFDVDQHFTPSYRPWRQRVAFVPDGDIFQGLASGQASVVTDEIERFTKKGIQLASGQELEADIIVTATGFNLCLFGDIAFTVDGEPVDWAEAVTYHGMMFTGVPNMLWIMGYFRASWTLRADLLSDFVCRLLKHMDEKGVSRVTPRLRGEDAEMTIGPWMDPDNFNPNYLMRSLHLMPRAGDKPEWQHTQDYWLERKLIPAIDLDDEAFEYA